MPNVNEATMNKAARLYNAGRVHQTMDGRDHGNYKVELRTASIDEPHGTCDCPASIVYCSHILAAMLHAKARP